MNFPWTNVNVLHYHYSFVMLLMYLNLALGHGQGMVAAAVTRRCHFYNSSTCPAGADSCGRHEQCAEPEPGRRSMCFVLWKNSTVDPIKVELKGCILDMEECYSQSECVATKPANRGAYFCCCEGDHCNRDFRWNVQPAKLTTPAPFTKRASDQAPETALMAVVILAPIVLVTVCVLVVFLVYRCRKPSSFNEIPSVDSGLMCPPSPLPLARPVQLLEIVTRGRFVAIWRGQLRAEPVAVKIFPGHERRSWQVEREVLELPQIGHENLMRFIGVEKHTDLAQVEYWIISEYCHNGSLSDYLKGHLVSWPEALRVAEGVARGLAHLHEESPPSRAGAVKPAVAHRDFKSKNVLLRRDLTACVADFGLALVFHPHRAIGDVHPQVGTRRYMAPEVLEGSICFHRDAFLRIDMYALGLVLWELASRCSAAPGPVADYRLPFEQEVGPHPSLDDMQEQVANRRVRPRIEPHWRLHQGLEVLCETADDCWDNDAEARVSAGCVLERMCSLRQHAAAGPPLHTPTVPTVAAATAAGLAEPLLPGSVHGSL